MIVARMKEKYDVVRENRRYMISSINDYIICFAMKVLASKLIRKMHPTQCTADEITLVQLYAEGIQINWSHFLLNKLLQESIEPQEDGKAFHYSWLLILISFNAWSNPPSYQGVDLSVHYRGA